jgi:adenosylcobinamide-phosphate synthase
LAQQVAFPLAALAPAAPLLAAAVVADLALGDPSYAAHPVRIMGWTLSRVEAGLRRLGADEYGGGIALFFILAALWLALSSAAVCAAANVHAWLGIAVHGFLLYSLLALGDLLRHGWRVEAALRREDLAAAREAVSRLVGRDVDRMDAAACRRAVIESLSENLTDGFVSPIFWYTVGGLPGLVLFKVVSTMDSMVGYKTPRYFRFGWCGARLDDLMNWLPARLTWLLLAASAALVPGCSPVGALRVGFRQHGVLPSPNSGWSEAATAGAIERRLVGPVWRQGQLVTERWLGDPLAPPAESAADYTRSVRLVLVCGLVVAGLACSLLILLR